jgi:hypothetical protein
MMRTIILAVAVASVSVIGALASLPPAEELTRGEFIWSEEGKAEPGSMPLCSLPTPGPNIAMPTVEINKSSRLQATHGSNW